MGPAQRRIITALACSLPLLAGCSSPAPAGPSPVVGAAAPVLSVGDHWELGVQITSRGTTSQANLTMTVNSTTEKWAIGAGTYEAVLLETRTHQTSGPVGWRVIQRVWQRTADGSQLHANVTTIDDKDGSQQVSVTEYDGPCRQYPWPITVGATMSGECRTHDPAVDPPQITTTKYTVTALAMENITVPAGTFETYRLNFTIESGIASHVTQVRWYSPKVCNDVRTETRTGQGAFITELKSYSCATGA
ncbi:MAG: hypothetical protein V4510_02695 [bacterium]